MSTARSDYMHLESRPEFEYLQRMGVELKGDFVAGKTRTIGADGDGRP